VRARARSSTTAMVAATSAAPHGDQGDLHLVQEYARHVGHLDIVSELADGQVGE
jgi:hypothetical protein